MARYAPFARHSALQERALTQHQLSGMVRSDQLQLRPRYWPTRGVQIGERRQNPRKIASRGSFPAF
jgi:hypothetical protein